VSTRYSAAAKERDGALCCPITYDPKYLKVIPQEILDRDYGCGDPSRYVRPGDTVLDLGSGGGKMCFIVSQVVGPKGRVIGVDMTDDMLALACKHKNAVGRAIGWQNVEFRKGRIQDLALDLERVDEELKRQPITSATGYLEMEHRFAEMRASQPMIASQSVDVVISNCVLNLVDPAAKEQLFAEIFRVLKVGGRAVISDIVSDKPVPAALMDNPELWSGCIAGALVEADFLEAFRRVGFGRVETRQRQEKPWRELEGVEFRSVTVEATRDKGVTTAQSNSRQFSVWPVAPTRLQAVPGFVNDDSCCGDSKCC
jgi:ubiquinone/menaquinone biosynthesis C-methylase UbiE